MLNQILTFIICITASSLGAVCGVGGGIIIRPLLEIIGLGDADVCSFLSGCTVLAMSCYSVISIGRERELDAKSGLSLVFGAAAGGILGKSIFELIKDLAYVSLIQAIVLGITIIGCIFYTLAKSGIRPIRTCSNPAGTLIGLLLGMISSFLGIGGGPINLIALHYFYGCDSKAAAGYSLFIILLSQTMSLITSIIGDNIPQFDRNSLAVIIFAGILGGVIGRKINNKINNAKIDKLFLAFLSVVLGICIVNAMKITIY